MSMKKKHPVKRRDNSSSETEIELYNRLFNTVAEYCYNTYYQDVDEVLSCDWGGVFQDDQSDIQDSPFSDAFFDWLIHADSIFEIGFTGIELFLEEKKRLTAPERAMLVKMNESIISLFEITVSESRDSVLYQDLLLGDEFRIDGLDVPSDKTRGLIAGRRIVLGGQLLVGFGYYPFDPELKNEILEEVHEGFDAWRESGIEADMEQYLKNVDPLPDFWLEGFENDEDESLDYLPDEMESAIFKIVGSYKKVLEKLNTISSLEEVEKKEPLFIWVDDGDDAERNQRGVIAVSKDFLILGAFTPELREAGKIMLLSACSGLIQHVRDMEFDTKNLFDSSGEGE
jgi:hypothetical protein